MIAGLGMDIVKTERIKMLLEKNGVAFLHKILAEDEIKEYSSFPLIAAEKIAGKWAAKEAVAKALGCGFGENCAIKDIHILHNCDHAPIVTVSGEAEKYAGKLGVEKIFLTITHEKEYAAATAILEK